MFKGTDRVKKRSLILISITILTVACLIIVLAVGTNTRNTRQFKYFLNESNNFNESNNLDDSNDLNKSNDLGGSNNLSENKNLDERGLNTYKFPGEFEKQQAIWMQWPSEVYNAGNRPVNPVMVHIIKSLAPYIRINLISQNAEEIRAN